MFAASVTSISIWPLRACRGLPSTSMLTRSSLILLAVRYGSRGPAIVVLDDAPALVLDHVFEFVAEVFQEALHRPRGGITQRADGVALDLVGHVEEFVQVVCRGPALQHAGQHAVQPASALAAGGALAAGLRHVEAG